MQKKKEVLDNSKKILPLIKTIYFMDDNDFNGSIEHSAENLI